MSIPGVSYLLLQDTVPAMQFGVVTWVVVAALLILTIAGIWRVFQKAGEPGWASIIPIYNMIVLLKVARKPLWWFFLLLIPIINLIVWIIMYVAIARNFGKGVGFAIGMFLLSPIFFPILGFGDAQYQPAPPAQPAT